MVKDLRHHLVGLVMLIGTADNAQGITVAQFAPQLLVEYMRVIGDQGIGGLEYARGRTVVLLQLDDLQPGKVFLQLHQVLRACAAPGIDGLVVVAHHGESATQAN